MESHASLRGRHVLVLNWRDTSHPEGGGSELYVEQMARGLAASGALVTMICPRYPGAAARETRDGVDYRRIGGRLSIYFLIPLLALLRRLPRHDLVVEIQNGVPFLACSYLTAPVVVVVHHVHREQWPIVFSPMLARVGWWLESKVAPRVGRRAQYVTVSGATRDELVAMGVDAHRVALVHNGSPAQGDIVAATRSETPLVVALGRLVPHKRVEIAIEALADLRRDHPDARLMVVGEGWWHARLCQRATELGVADHVTFTGHVTDEEKNRLLARAWVSALPSVKEGWGLVVVEAGLHQTPTIAFRAAGGVRESVVDGDTGILVDDAEAFTAALRRLLDDVDLRDQMGRMAEKYARSFTWEASQRKFATLAAGLLTASL